MLRALYLQELRRSWLAHAGLFAAIFGTVALVVRIATRESPLSPDEERFLSALLFGSLLLSGLISGERCFPAAFKEGRYTFLLTLPRPRGGIWLAYLGGRLIGALAALPVLLIALRSQWRAPWGWPLLIAALSVYLVYFLGSAALALAFRKEILVYLVGLPLLTGLLALLGYCASYGIAPTEHFYSAYLLQPSPYLRAFASGSLLLATTWTAIGLRAFCRGEIHLSLRAMRTLAEGGLASAALAGLFLVACSSSALAAIGRTWSPNAVYRMESRWASADGRFLFIGQQLRSRPVFTRVAVVDLEDGNITRWLERPGIRQASWSASEPVLNVLAVDDTPADCLGLPCKGSTSWYRLSPDLRLLSIRKFPGTGVLRQVDGCLLLVTRQGNTGRIYRLSDRDGSFDEILSRTSEDVPRAWTLEAGAVVVFPTATTLRAWWLDPHGRVRHEDSVGRRAGQPYFFVGHRILFVEEVLAEARQRGRPPLSREPASWDLLRPQASEPLDFGSGQFYLERYRTTGYIWWRDEERGTWTRIPEEFHLADLGRLKSVLSLRFPELIDYQRSGLALARVDVDHRTGILAAVVPSQGRRQLYFFDGRLGRSIPSSVACPGENGAISLSLTKTQGLEGLLVRLTCWDQNDLMSSRLLQLVPGSGRVRDLSWLSPIVESEHFGQWIYLNPEGASVWLSKTGEVWQAGPGRKRRLLNPPSS